MATLNECDKMPAPASQDAPTPLNARWPSAAVLTAATLACCRALIGGTLAFAVFPAPRIFAAVAALEALLGVAHALGVHAGTRSRTRVALALSVAAELIGRAAWLHVAAPHGALDSEWALGFRMFLTSGFFLRVLWFAPPLIGAWVGARLFALAAAYASMHPFERARRTTMACGLALGVSAACSSILLRRTPSLPVGG